MALIFISHASKDNEKVEPINEKLRANGFHSIFLDYHEEDGIQMGEEWEQRLYDELNRSHILLVLLSPAWIASSWCQYEHKIAKAMGKFIIPIIIDHGKEGEVTRWIDNHIQRSDLTKDASVLDKVIGRIKKITLETQQGFEWDANRSPFPGLVAFEEQDSAVFFGKNEDTLTLIEILNDMRVKRKKGKFLNIISASGLGKSSLVKAGVIPKLKLTQKEEWFILPALRPQNDPLYRPLYSFAKRMAQVLEQDYKGLYARLKGDEYEACLDDIVSDLEKLSFESTFLLLVDQSEELYTLATQEERELFYRAIEYLFKRHENFLMLWTLRADFLKDFQQDLSAKSLRRYESSFTKLSPISKENIASIIKEPAKVGGISVEESLVEKLKDDIETSDALPLLAFCLYELYRKHKDEGKLTLAHYKNLAIGDENPLESIIRQKADETIEEYTHDAKVLKALKEAFIPHLVRINSQNEYVKRTALWRELPEDAYPLLESLVSARLLIKRDDSLEIAHEALIRKWELLKSWLDEEQEFLIGKSQLEVALVEWKKSLKSEKALYSAIRLEKALVWKDKLTNEEEINFIELSLKNQEKHHTFMRNLVVAFLLFLSLFAFIGAYQWTKAEKSLEESRKQTQKARYSLGVMFSEKAEKAKLEKKLQEANLYAFLGLSYLDNYMDTKNIRAKLHTLLYTHPAIKTSFIKTFSENFDLLSISDNNQYIIFSTSNEKMKKYTINIMDLNKSKVVWTLDTFGRKIYGLNMTSDNKQLLVGYFSDYSLVNIENKNIIYETNNTDFPTFSFSMDSHILYNDELIIKEESDDVQFINILNNKKELLFHVSSIKSIKLSPDKKYIVASSYNQEIHIYDIEKRKIIKILNFRKKIEKMILSHDNKFLVLHIDNEGLLVVNQRNGKVIKELKNFKYGTSNMIITKDDKYFLSTDYEGDVIRIWSLESDSLVEVISTSSAVKKLALSHDSSYVVGLLEDKSLRIWDLTNLDKQTEYIHNPPPYRNKYVYDWTQSMAISPNSQYALSGSSNGVMYLWNLLSYKNEFRILAHNGNISSLDFYGKMILSASSDKTIKIWDINTRKLLKTFMGHKDKVNSAKMTANHKYVISASDDKTVKIWDVNKSKVFKTLKEHSGKVSVIDIASNQKFFISSAEDNSTKIWDLKTFKLLDSLQDTAQITDAVISKDSQYIITSCVDGTINIWDSTWGMKVKTIQNKGKKLGKAITSIDISSANDFIVSGTSYGKVIIWNTATGEEVKTLETRGSSVRSVKLAKNNRFVLSGGVSIKYFKLAPLDYNYFAVHEHINQLYKELPYKRQSEFGDHLDYAYNYKYDNVEWSDLNLYHLTVEAEHNLSAMLKLAHLYEHKNQNDKALTYYKKASDLGNLEAKEEQLVLEKWRKSVFHVNELMIEAEGYSILEQYEKSVEVYSKALDLSIEYSILDRIEEIIKQLGYLDRGLNLYNKYYVENKRVISFIKKLTLPEIPKKNFLAYLYLEQGTTYLFQKKREEANISFNETKKYYKTILDSNLSDSMNYIDMFELSLVMNEAFDKELEEEYLKRFTNNAEKFVYYDALKTLQKIAQKEEVSFENWKRNYSRKWQATYNFITIESWITNEKDAKVKKELYRFMKLLRELNL